MYVTASRQRNNTVKTSRLVFFCGFWGGNEKFAEIRAGSLSRLTALPLDFALTATPFKHVSEVGVNGVLLYNKMYNVYQTFELS